MSIIIRWDGIMCAIQPIDYMSNYVYIMLNYNE